MYPREIGWPARGMILGTAISLPHSSPDCDELEPHPPFAVPSTTEVVAPGEGQGRAEERKGDEGPPLVLALEGTDQHRDRYQGKEQEERERHPPAQFAEEAAPE